MQLFKLILLNECYHLSQYIFFEIFSTYVEVTTKVHVILDFPSYVSALFFPREIIHIKAWPDPYNTQCWKTKSVFAIICVCHTSERVQMTLNIGNHIMPFLYQ